MLDLQHPDRHEVRVFMQPSATMEDLCKVIESQLPSGPPDVVIMSGMYCDLTELRPTGPGTNRGLCQALAKPNLDKLQQLIRRYDYQWRTQYPGLAVFWTAPQRIDILRLNRYRDASIVRGGGMCGYCEAESQLSSFNLQANEQKLVTSLEKEVHIIQMQPIYDTIPLVGGGDGLHLSDGVNQTLYSGVIDRALARLPQPPPGGDRHLPVAARKKNDLAGFRSGRAPVNTSGVPYQIAESVLRTEVHRRSMP